MGGRPDAAPHPATQRNDRCVGRSVGFADVAILRENGTLAAPYEHGFLGAKPPSMTVGGYWGGNQDTYYRSILAGYWLTGDIAYRDEDGYFYQVDRAVDVVHTADGPGYSVQMEELVLNEVVGVKDCTVVAGGYRNEKVPVAVVTGEDIDPAKVLSAANEALRATGKPELAMVEVASADSDFPLGVTGKSLKRYLRDKYADLVAYLATAEARPSPRALRSPNSIGNTMAKTDTLLVFDETVTRAGIEGWLRHLETAGTPTEMYRLGGTLVLSVADVDLIDKAGPELPAPTRQVSRNSDVWLGRKELRPGGTEVSLGPTTIGDGSVAVIAGPCAVESPEQTLATAAVVTDHGAVGLRGGVFFKPRTSPHSFQGLQWDASTCWPRPGSEPASLFSPR